MDARVKILSGPFAGQALEITGGKLLIGREPDCQLRVQDEFVSSYHCVLLLDEYTLRIRDLGSKNGTFVNGHRVRSGELILLPDDTITIGGMRLVVDIVQDPVPAPPAEPETPPESETMMEPTGYYQDDTVFEGGPMQDPPPMAEPPTVTGTVVPNPPAQSPAPPPSVPSHSVPSPSVEAQPS
jgi:pSer/pThr/pTyr-binding forkhead associated (FHA) protein